MECSFALKYLVKIVSKDEEIIGSGVIVKLKDFPNNFFVFTSKHTFEDDDENLQIEKNNFSIHYEKDVLSYKSYIALDEDIVVFIFDNSIDVIKLLDRVSISTKNDKFGDCFFRGYASSETDDGSLCERCSYHQEVETQDNLYRIQPNRDTNSFDNDGLTNAKGFSGSGLFIKEDKTLVGIIKEHEENLSFYNYVALAPLEDEILTRLTDLLCKQLTIPKELIDEIKTNNVVLFVGNEFSSSVGNFASTKEFTFEVLDSVEDVFQSFKPMLETNAMSSNQVLDILKAKNTEMIKDKIVELYGIIPTNNYFVKTFWKITSNIITTNYDNFLESNMDNIKVISTHNKYKIYPTNKRLFKLHGNTNDKDNLLIFEDDFTKFYKSKELREIKKILKDKSCLFIGFSTDEVYFKSLFNTLGCKKKNYIISTIQKDFSKYNLEVINISNYAQLNNYFNEIFKEEINIIKEEAEIKINMEDTNPTVCVYTASPLNSNIDYNSKAKNIFKQLKDYRVEVFHKILNEDNLLDFYGEYDYNFIFTNTNKEKIIIEDEYFIQKSIDLDDLEGMVESVDNTILFLDKEIAESIFKIYKIEKDKLNRLKPIFHKAKFFEKGKSKEYMSSTILPDLINKKIRNSFLGRATSLQGLIRLILTVKSENKILTIKGSGGIGKTTIISKAVIEMADRGKFKEGIKFVPCEFIKDYNDFENKISYAFFGTHKVFEFTKQLQDLEQSSDRLVILDNVETLLYVDDKLKIKNLIRTISEYATVVITSRELLNERDYEEVYDLYRLTTDEAEKLFLTLSNSEIEDYDSQILRTDILENLLDNNPLAIELVTNNLLQGKDLNSLREELKQDLVKDDDEIFDRKESDRNIERQKSLFNSISYSYLKLTDKEKLALETLSLFPDGISIDNLKNFYNQKIENDKKTILHKLKIFSDKDIKSLVNKSLVLNNSGLIMLQSIIGRFAESRFNQRSPKEQNEFYKRAYDFNNFLIKVITNIIDNKLKKIQRILLFNNNKNNLIKSLDYIMTIDVDDEKLIYIDRVIDTFAGDSSYNESLIKKLQNIKNSFINDSIKNNFIESVDIGLKYYYGNFDKMYDKLEEVFPLKSILEKDSINNNVIQQRTYANILNIYAMEGYAFEYLKVYLKSKLMVGISELFLTGEYSIAKKILDKNKAEGKEKDFFEFELLLALKILDDVGELKRYIKEFNMFEIENIEKTQVIYTLLKSEKELIELKTIEDLIPINPFTHGLKLLMFAIKDESDNLKSLYEDAIEKLYHIKYYHVEAILIYSRYLKDIGDDDYTEWFEKGKELADKYHYRYLLHQFNCLDSEVYTEYDENNYPLPEPLDYSRIIKKYGLDV